MLRTQSKISEALRTAELLEEGQDFKLTRLTSNTNEVFLISIGSYPESVNQYVIKLFREVPTIDRELETLIEQLSGEADIAPKVIYRDDEVEILPFMSSPSFTAFMHEERLAAVKTANEAEGVPEDAIAIEGQLHDIYEETKCGPKFGSFAIATLIRENYLAAATDVLRQLHSIDVPEGAIEKYKNRTVLTDCQELLNAARAAVVTEEAASSAEPVESIIPLELTERVENEIHEFQIFLEGIEYTPRLYHADPSHKNFLMNQFGKLYLTDYEYAKIGDPIYDLAAFRMTLYLSAKQEQVFLAQYTLDESESARYQIYRAVNVLWKLCWYCEEINRSDAQISVAALNDSIEQRLGELETIKSSPEFQAALEFLDAQKTAEPALTM